MAGSRSFSLRSGVPVYPPRGDTLLLVPFARGTAHLRVLEIGTGSGEVALEAARCGGRVVATDLNPHALRLARRSARKEGLGIDLVRTDLARGLGRFDRILANPPYLPTGPGQRDPDPWQNLALDGGADGCAVTERIVQGLPDHLLPGASAFVVSSSLQSEPALKAILERWTSIRGEVETAASNRWEGERLSVLRLWMGKGAPPG